MLKNYLLHRLYPTGTFREVKPGSPPIYESDCLSSEGSQIQPSIWFYIRQESKYLNYCNSCKAGLQEILHLSKFYFVSKCRNNAMKYIRGGISAFSFNGHMPTARCQGSECTRAPLTAPNSLTWGLHPHPLPTGSGAPSPLRETH